MSTKMRKQLLSVWMSACMVVALLIMAALTTGTAQAADTTSDDDAILPVATGSAEDLLKAGDGNYTMPFLIADGSNGQATGGNRFVQVKDLLYPNTGNPKSSGGVWNNKVEKDAGATAYTYSNDFTIPSDAGNPYMTVNATTTYTAGETTIGETTALNSGEEGKTSSLTVRVLSTTDMTLDKLNASSFYFDRTSYEDESYYIYLIDTWTDSTGAEKSSKFYLSASGASGDSEWFWLKLKQDTGDSEEKARWYIGNHSSNGVCSCYTKVTINGEEAKLYLSVKEGGLYVVWVYEKTLDSGKKQYNTTIPNIKLYGNLSLLVDHTSSDAKKGYDAFRIVDGDNVKNVAVKRADGYTYTQITLPNSTQGDFLYWADKKSAKNYYSEFADYTNASLYTTEQSGTPANTYANGASLTESQYAGKTFYSVKGYALNYSVSGLKSGHSLDVRTGTVTDTSVWAAEKNVKSGTKIASGNWVTITLPAASKTGYNYTIDSTWPFKITNAAGENIIPDLVANQGYHDKYTLSSGATYIYFKMPAYAVNISFTVSATAAPVTKSAKGYFVTENSDGSLTYAENTITASGLTPIKLSLATNVLDGNGYSQVKLVSYEDTYGKNYVDNDDDMFYSIASCKWYVKIGENGEYEEINTGLTYKEENGSGLNCHRAELSSYIDLPSVTEETKVYYKCEYKIKRNVTDTVGDMKTLELVATVTKTELPEDTVYVSYKYDDKTYTSGQSYSVGTELTLYASTKDLNASGSTTASGETATSSDDTITNCTYSFVWYLESVDKADNINGNPQKLGETTAAISPTSKDELVASCTCKLPKLSTQGKVAVKIWAVVTRTHKTTKHVTEYNSRNEATLTLLNNDAVEILDYDPAVTSSLESDNIFVKSENVTKWEYKYSTDNGSTWTEWKEITLNKQERYTYDTYQSSPVYIQYSLGPAICEVYRYTVTKEAKGIYVFRMTNSADGVNTETLDFTGLHEHVWGDYIYYNKNVHVKKCTVKGCKAYDGFYYEQNPNHTLGEDGYCTICQKRAPIVTTETLAGGIVGSEYSQKLTATGTPDITWSLAEGDTLPTGLSLDAATGTVSGTPTAKGTFSFTVKADNSEGSYTKSLCIVVAGKTPEVTAPTAVQGLIYTGAEQTLVNTGSAIGGILKYRLSTQSVDGYSETLPVGKNAGTYTVCYKVFGNDEYADSEEASITVNIAPKAITVKAKDQTITAGDALPSTFELEYSGFVEGESAADAIADYETVIGTVAEGVDGKTTGTFDITVPTLTLNAGYAGNYTISTQNGTLTVNARRSSGGGTSGGGTSGGAVVAPSTDTSKDAGSDNVVNKAENKKTDTAASTTATITNTTTKTTTTTPATDGQKAITTTTITSTVDTTTANKIVEKAVENKSKEVVIDAQTSTPSTSSSQGNSAAEVIIPTTTITQLSEKTSAKVIIKTDSASIALDKKAVAAITEQIKVASEASGTGATGEAGDSEQSSGAASQGAAGTTSGDTAAGAAAADTLKLTVTTVEQTKSSVKLDVKIETANGQIKSFNGGKVTVTVNLNSQLASKKKLVCVYINDQKLYSRMPGKKNANGTFTFTTTHFSTYAIMTEEEVDQIIAEQTAEAKELASKIKLSASSKKTSKGNIKVTLKLTKGTTSFQKLENLGYTVKYKFYRSTKKSSSYKAMTEKAGKTYTNTTGKKGTRYYYKARVMIYDSEGTLVASTALKSCKYATRKR